MRLVLARHGETEWNRTRRLQGQADAPLSERGREQAAALAPVFRNGLAPDRVVASDLPRARVSAAIMGFGDAALDARFREIDVGEWSGRMIADIQAESMDDWRGWRAGSHTPPGGESWEAFKARVLDGVADLAKDGDGTTLVVAHGGVIRAACEALVGLAAANVVPVGPASLTIFDVSTGPNGVTAKLEGYNVAPANPHLGAPD
jgi:probable phosphoglycerate mutase